MTALGSRIPTTEDAAADPGVGAYASAAEEAGAGALWVADHVVLARDVRSRYPYADDGRLRVDPATPWYEALVACAWAAAHTTTATVGTAVLVLPQRHPVEVAKQAATIDALSGGRLLLGVGAGWMREEFEALGWPYEDRGRRLDEAIAVLRSCWTGEPGPFEGETLRVPAGLTCYPTPARPGGVPIYVGGMTGRAIRRAAALGDGWLALANLDEADPATLGAALERVHAARPAGRPPLRTVLRLVGTIAEDDLARRLPLLRDLAAAGFDEIAVDPPWPDLDAGRRVLDAVAAVLA